MDVVYINLTSAPRTELYLNVEGSRVINISPLILCLALSRINTFQHKLLDVTERGQDSVSLVLLGETKHSP